MFAEHLSVRSPDARFALLGRRAPLEAASGSLVPVQVDVTDRPALERAVADYELRPVWCLIPQTKLKQARQLLGLDTGAMLPV